MYDMRSWLPSFGALGGATAMPQQSGLTAADLMALFPQFMNAPVYPQYGMQTPDWAALLARFGQQQQSGQPAPGNGPVDAGGDYNWQGFGP